MNAECRMQNAECGMNCICEYAVQDESELKTSPLELRGRCFCFAEAYYHAVCSEIWRCLILHSALRIQKKGLHATKPQIGIPPSGFACHLPLAREAWGKQKLPPLPKGGGPPQAVEGLPHKKRCHPPTAPQNSNNFAFCTLHFALRRRRLILHSNQRCHRIDVKQRDHEDEGY